MNLQTSTDVLDNFVLVTLAGDLDFVSGTHLHEHVLDMLSAHERPVVLDLSAVTFLDSTGTGMLVASHAAARRRKLELRLAAPSQIVSKVLRITGIDGYLRVFPDRQIATSEQPAPPHQPAAPEEPAPAPERAEERVPADEHADT